MPASVSVSAIEAELKARGAPSAPHHSPRNGRRLPPYAAEQLRVAGVAGTLQPHRSSTGAKGVAGGQNADTTRVPNLSL
jgi:hypothetical protein